MKQWIGVALVVVVGLGCSPIAGVEDGPGLSDIGQDNGSQTDVVIEIKFVTDLTGPGDTVVLPENKSTDSIPTDLPSRQCDPGEGCFLDECSENSQCQSGWCVEHMGEQVCTQSCQEECPPGWTCTQVGAGGPDVLFICISDYPNLCRPCAEADDCAGVAGTEDACVAYGDPGSFCGGKCDEEGDCPWGFECQTVTTVDGIELDQCVASTGECPCTDTAVELGLFTPCQVTNEFGICEGKRVCTEDGLTDCDALAPAVETCNGFDDNCDGDVDESSCDDENQCTEDSCLGQDGCEHLPLASGECMDDNPCTKADHCEQGICVGELVDCDDGNPCTDDFCTELGGCEHDDNSASCDDSDPCTLGDECMDGQCAGFQVPCDCLEDADCGQLEDGDVCNGLLYCETAELPYTCTVDVGTLIECPNPEGPDAHCLQAYCSPATGECSFVAANEGLPCEEGDLCTLGDKCIEGQCTPGNPVNCNDGNPCTDETCNPAEGCASADNVVPCNDGDICTTQDLCNAGQCLGGPLLDCSDEDVCNGLESCNSAVGCVAGEPLTCVDDDMCNGIESCDPVAGCVVGQNLECNDGNPCTDDSCDAMAGCVFAEVSGPECDDGNACTELDVCQNGVCLGTGEVECLDDNPCTDSICEPGIGCVSTINQALCDDDDLCTTGDHCHLGECISAGVLPCNDGNDCTEDSCDPQAGCQFVANQNVCDDGNLCTEGDLCAGGWCVPGVFLDCDDGNDCSKDICVAALGCQHESLPDGIPCGEDFSLKCGDGICICIPDCGGKKCGSNGCGDVCGTCNDGNHEVCADFICLCDADSGFHLSDDGSTCTTDLCDPNPCNLNNHEVCSGGNCACDADAGFHLSADQSTCTLDPCDPNPCNPDNDEICEGGECKQYTMVGGIVEDGAVWTKQNSPYLVTNPILVEAGKSLTIEPGVTVAVAPGSTYIKVEGSLVAVGDCENDPIVFTTKKNPPVSKSWGGIQIRPGGGTVFNPDLTYQSGSKFECVRIEYADTGLYVYNTGLLVDRGTFFRNEEGIEIRGTYQFVLLDSRLEENVKGLYSVHSGQGDSLNPITDTLVQGNTFLNNTNGITLTVNQRHFAGLKILDNEFRGQSSTALSVGGGGYGPYLHSAVITGNWIDETSGTGLQVGGFYSVGTNGPQVGSALLPVPEHALVVSNNLIENCTGRALSITDVKGGKPHVFGNTLAASQSGQGCLFVSGSIYQPGLVTRNTIAFSSSGIEIGSKVSGLVVQDNDLSRLSNLAKAFVSQGGTGHTISGNNMDMGGVTLGGIADITMTNNWWGTVAANEIAALIHDYNDNFELGKVLFEPVLAVPSPDAPVAPPANVTKQETPGGIQVTWNASIEPDLAGYKVSSGERTRFTFENTVDVGNVTTYLLPGANLDTPIAVSAYDAEADGVEDHLDGHESWFSSAQLP